MVVPADDAPIDVAPADPPPSAHRGTTEGHLAVGGPDAEVVDLAAHRRVRGRWLLSAAAAVAVALVGISAFFLTRPAGPTNDAEALLRCVNSASDQHQMPPAPGSAGRTSVTVSVTCGAAVLAFADVPALPTDRTYQLWVMSGEQTRSVGTMVPEADGSMPETVAAVHVGDTALGVTVEPVGGSPVPTTPPVITVLLSA